MEVGNSAAFAAESGICGSIRRAASHQAFFSPTQKGHPSGWPLAYLMPGSSLLSHRETHTTMALRRFTSEFGMGSGGTTALQPARQILFYQTASAF